MRNIRRCFSNKIKLLLSLLAIFSLTACQGLFSGVFADSWGQEEVVCEADTTAVTFKQVGYWLEGETDDLEDVDYDQLTHFIFGYLQVNADGSLASSEYIGNFQDSNNFKNIIEDIQNDHGSKVFISIGGDSSAINFTTIAADNALTSIFVDNVIDFVEQYDLDGVDLSWQFPDSDDEGELFEDLVKELSSELEDEGKLLTIEVVSGLDDSEELADTISSDLFAYVDFVNIRAFEIEGGDDSLLSTDDLLDVISYWIDRCLIQNKLVVGIPLYSGGVGEMTYAEILDDNIEHACDADDRVSIGSEYYYFNAIPTIIEKTAYAQTYAGGVVVMSLEQDSYDDPDYSVLRSINEAVVGNDNDICD